LYRLFISHPLATVEGNNAVDFLKGRFGCNQLFVIKSNVGYLLLSMTYADYRYIINSSSILVLFYPREPKIIFQALIGILCLLASIGALIKIKKAYLGMLNK
jgi:hypothetical protein